MRLAGIQHVFAVDVANARGADRAVKGNAGYGQRGAGTDQRSDIGRDLGVQRHHMNDDLYLVVETFWEQRTQRAVDQPRGQRFQFAGTAFALEEAARNLSRGIGLFNVVNGQREEVLTRLRVLRANHGGQNHGVVDVDQHGAARLAGDFTGFQHDGVLTPLEGLGDFVEHAHMCLRLRSAPCGWRLRTQSCSILARCHSSDVH